MKKTTRFTRTLVLLFLVCANITIRLYAQEALPDAWITNGEVNNIATGDGKVVLMGGFDWFGPAYYGGTLAFNNTLVEDESFPKVEGEVLNAILDDAGGWYVAIRDRATPYESKILHIHADKTIDELVLAGESTWINALAKSGSTLYFGGYFQSVNGVTRNSAAAINLTNNTLTSWNPTVDVNGYIRVLTVSGSTVYAGGAFSNIGGQARTYIAALDATTGLATSWNVTVTGNALTEVSTILVNVGIVYFGGYFDNVNAATPSRRYFAAVNATTAALETFNPRPDGWVRTMLLDGGMLYLAGGFDQVLGVSRFRVARIELATSTLTPFELIFVSNTNPNFFGFDQVNAIGIDGNKLFIGGTFETVNNVAQPHLAAVDKTTGVLEPSDKKIYGEINTMLINGGNIFVGGYVIGHLGTSVNGIAALDETTGTGLPEWTDNIPPVPAGEYYADIDFHFQNGRAFYRYNLSDGTTRIGALNADDGSEINTWSVTVNDEIDDWAFSGDALYLAGSFTLVNSVSREYFAGVDLVTGNVTPWIMDHSLAIDDGDGVNSIAVLNNTLYVAGQFAFSANGADRNNLAAWSTITGALTSWAPENIFTNGYVTLGAVLDKYVYVFSEGVSRIDAISGKHDTGWAPNPIFNGVNTMAIFNNVVFLAGGFSPGLVVVDIATADLVSWQPDIENVEDNEGSVRAIAVAGSKLLVGGNFYYHINEIQRFGYAEYLLPDDITPEPGNDIVIYNAISPNGDGKNDSFLIQYIDIIPETQNNRVTIFNRWGDTVFTITGYNNDDRIFRGENSNGKALPTGTYFYKIEYASGRKTETGYLALKR
jgi:gliding motility-associated-like protein